jgi:hypothetical protein
VGCAAPTPPPPPTPPPTPKFPLRISWTNEGAFNGFKGSCNSGLQAGNVSVDKGQNVLAWSCNGGGPNCVFYIFCSLSSSAPFQLQAKYTYTDGYCDSQHANPSIGKSVTSGCSEPSSTSKEGRGKCCWT